MPSINPRLQERMGDAAQAVEKSMDYLLPLNSQAEQRISEAMRYSSLGGGKRLRAFLVLCSARLFGVSESRALRVGAAIEFIHAFSLIHDDLPCMDDADLRRGRPSCHKQFDEATAVLAGDALVFHAFEVLSDPQTHEDPHVRCALMAALARASGAGGMCGGQMLDMIALTTALDIGAITRLQRMKTGELIAFSCEAGAILGRAAPAQHQALRKYAHDLGLAFQIADDLLDAEGTTAETGKPVGRDAGKATFVSILGPERARAQAQLLSEQAARHLNIFENRAQDLVDVARFVVERRT